MTVGMLIAIVLSGMIGFSIGWLMSATATSADIAQAINTGKLPLTLPLHELCERIETGDFRSLKSRATLPKVKT